MKQINSLKNKQLIELTFNSLLMDYKPSNVTTELTDELIEEMLNFTPIYKAINSLIRGVLSRDLIVRSEDNLEDDTTFLEIQKRINGIKNKTQFIETLIKSCFTGRTLNEIVYNEDFTIKEFITIPYKLIKYNNELRRYEIKARNNTIELSDTRKWLLSIYNKEIGYTLGKSLLESIVDDYMNIKEIESKMKYLWNKYGETLLIFAYGLNTSEEDVKKTAEELKVAQGKNVIAIPLSDGNLRDSIFSLRLVDMDTVIHERLIDRYEKNIVSTLLGGTLTIDNSNGSSSYSLGKIHQEEKEKIEDSIALYIRDELDKIIQIDGAFFGYDAKKYYISLERPENIKEQIELENKKTELLNNKIVGIEALSRSGYEIDENELQEYLGFRTLRTKEQSSRIKEFESKISNREEKEIRYIKLLEKYKEQIIEELIANTRKELRKVKKIEDIYKIEIQSEKQYKALILANLIGRYLTLDTVEKRSKKEFEKEEFNTLEEEIKAIVKRKPILYKDLEKITEEEKQNYFWVKKSQSLEITKRIQEILIKGIKEGKDKYNILIDLEDEEILLGKSIKSNYWSGAIDMNLALAQSRGNFEEMQVLKEKGFSYARYSAITDGRTTNICRSLHGKIMKIDEFTKNNLVPPLHYRCRSTLIQLADEDVVDSKGKVRKGVKLATKEDIKHFKKHKQKGFGNVRNDLEDYVKEKEKVIEKNKKTILKEIRYEEKELNRTESIKEKRKYRNKNIEIKYTLKNVYKSSTGKEIRIGYDKKIRINKENMENNKRFINPLIDKTLMKLEKLIPEFKGNFIFTNDLDDGTLASYSPKTNNIFLNYSKLFDEYIFNKYISSKDKFVFAYENNPLSTLIHELGHYYEKIYWKIPKNNIDNFYIVKSNQFIESFKNLGYNEIEIENKISQNAYSYFRDIKIDKSKYGLYELFSEVLVVNIIRPNKLSKDLFDIFKEVME